MKLDITSVDSLTHQNFLDYIRSDKTRINYSSDLQKFLDLIPNKIFQESNIDVNDKTEAFVTLVKEDVKLDKSIINAYVRELKKKVENKTISPARLLNLIKPIKAMSCLWIYQVLEWIYLSSSMKNQYHLWQINSRV
jgi:hypothetical protein